MRFRSVLYVIIVIAAVLANGLRAQESSDRRMALVIGNSDYESAPRLNNPQNDAEDLSETLKGIGFEVTTGLNLDFRSMLLTVRDFTERAQQADIVIVYFAGHGIEVGGENYLIPVDAELKRARDVELETVRLAAVLSSIESLRGLKIVLVDACRDNPFVFQMANRGSTRSIGRGLARVEPSGVLVSYAAKGGTHALDGRGRNSPYAEALLKHLPEQGLELGKLFRQVRDTVYALTAGAQEPFTYGSLPGKDIFLVPAALPTQPDTATPSSEPETVNPIDERELSAERVLGEALKVEDESVRQGALALIARLYPETQAGLAAKSAAEKIEQQERLGEVPDGEPKTETGKQNGSERVEQATIPKTPQTNHLKAETDLKLSRSDYRRIQRRLNALGFSVGVVDGIFGSRSRAALREFQSSSGASRTGYLTAESYAVLRSIEVPEKPSRDTQRQSAKPLSPEPQTNRGSGSADSYFGEYIVDIRRRPDPLGRDSGSGIDTMLWLKYRKSAAGFELVSAVDRSRGGESRSKRYSASLSDKGRLRISGRTNYLFNSTIVVPFSIALDLPADFAAGKSLRSTQGRFDKNWYVDVRVTRN